MTCDKKANIQVRIFTIQKTTQYPVVHTADLSYEVC